MAPAEAYSAADRLRQCFGMRPGADAETSGDSGLRDVTRTSRFNAPQREPGT